MGLVAEKFEPTPLEMAKVIVDDIERIRRIVSRPVSTKFNDSAITTLSLLWKV